MKTKKLLSFLLILFFLTGCNNKSDDETNNPSNLPGEFGAIGNAWSVKVDGNYDLSTQIIAKEDDIYTLEVSYAKIITKSLKFGLNGNEVVDYVYSQGDLAKPFTMVKFDAEVGDVYSAYFGENYHYREVVEIETYNVPCLGKDLEMIGVYEEIPPGIPNVYFGLTITSIVWYWHPDYGLVCVDFYTDDGGFHEVDFVNIDL